jgi:prolyl-tRNA editing enzyme YbaK/EbsC (Cys-tRNA(Pro) deacylase)
MKALASQALGDSPGPFSFLSIDPPGGDVKATDPKLASVIAAGAEIDIDVQPMTFSKDTRTAVDAAREIGCGLGQIVKSLVFEAGDEPLLFLVSGVNRLDTRKAMSAADVGALDKADAARVKEVTGYSIGATPPFGHVQRFRVFMDQDLLTYDEVWAAAGRPDSVFPVDPGALASATGATVCPLSETTS